MPDPAISGCNAGGLLLAELLPSDQPMLVMWVILGLVFLVNAANSAVSIWAKTRQQPPNHRVYATKEEVLALEERFDRRLGTIQHTLDAGLGAIKNTLEAELRSIHRTLGELEGRTKSLPCGTSNGGDCRPRPPR